MSAPVIDSTTSVLGFKQWETWQYQPYATNGPGRWRNNTALPSGLVLDIATGALSGPVQLPGVFLVGLTASNGYEVTRIVCNDDNAGSLTAKWFVLSGAGGSYAYWFKVDGSGSAPSTGATYTREVAIASNATAAAIAEAMATALLAENQWYVRRDGAALWLYDFALGTRTDAADGSAATGFLINTISQGAASAIDSAEVLFTIGIEPAAKTADILPALNFDLDTGEVTFNGAGATGTGDSAFLLSIKEGDDWLPRVTFSRSGTAIPVEIADDSLTLALKQYEPEGELVVSSASKAETGTDNYLLYCQFKADALTAALSDYEAETGTYFYGLAELRAVMTNPFHASLGIGAETLRKTSSTFRIRIERPISGE